MEDHRLITTTTTNSATTTSILRRFLALISIAAISAWANYEASKGFEIAVINDAANTPAGRRFHLLFVADDEATRIVLRASNTVERLLYPDQHRHNKKPIDRVTLRLPSRNLTHTTVLTQNPREFIVDIQPNILNEAHIQTAIMAVVQRAMARIWLWDGDGQAPVTLVDVMVEYVSMSISFAPLPESGLIALPESDNTCLYSDPVTVALFLHYCDGHRPGLLARLNRMMRHGWHERTVDEALGMTWQRLCRSFHYSKPLLLNGTDSTSALRLRQVM